MHVRSFAFKACALLLASLACAHALAAPQPLNESEMSSVRGADGSILVGVQPSSSNAQNPLASGLAAAFASSTGPSLLTPAQFASAMQAAGVASFADYAGQPVAQSVVDARPVTFSFNFSDVLQSTTGLQAGSGGSGSGNASPSLGTFTLKDFDARGTVIWVWQHH
jgi:hypothetical protein